MAVAGTLALAGAAVLPGAGTAAAAARATGPALVFSPSPYDFGPVSPGQSASKTFTLSNSGQKATGKLRVRLSGPAAFSITRNTCRAVRLRPGRACTITVRFAPSQADRITATLTAASKGGPRHAAAAADTLTGGQALGAAPGPGQIYWVSSDEIWAANLDGTSPHAIVTGQIGAEGIAVNSSHLYWADAPDGTIWEANLNGSSPHTILTSQRGQTGLAVTASQIYWANNGGGVDRAGTIWAANLDGSSPHAIVTGQDSPSWMAVTPAAPELSFSPAPYDYGSVPPGQPATQTFTLTNSGHAATGPLTVTLTGPAAFVVTGNACPATSLGPGQTCSITVRFTPAAGGAMTATLTAASTNPDAIATDALSGVVAPAIYWANASDHSPGAGAIWTANLDGTSPHAIATGQDDPAGVAVDASHLYWASAGDNAIVEAGLDGSSAHTIVTNQDEPFGVAVSAGHLYWSNFSVDEQIWEANLDGSNPHAIVTGALAPELQGGVAVNADHIYWGDLNQGAVAEANLDGSNPHTIITDENGPDGVAVAGQLYWTSGGFGGASTGTVSEANLDGSSRHIIVTGQAFPQMMAVTPAGP